MDFTSRMAALLGAFRRERNGAVADSMRFYGAPCGLNYGVSLPTLRTLARAEAVDHDFAKYLWQQDVRCLRLAALHIADPARLTPGEFAFWGDGLLNSEIAAEAAFALLSRIGAFPELFAAWIAPDAGWLRQYAALMAAARPGADKILAFYDARVDAVCRDARCLLLPLDDHMCHRGDALFESLCYREGRIFALEEHLARLRDGSRALSLLPPCSWDELRARILDVARASGTDHGDIRVLVGRGPGGFGVSPEECPQSSLYIVALRKALPTEAFYEKGLTAFASAIPPKQEYLARIKSTNYLPNVFMAAEARQRGMDVAVTFDEDGHLGEAAIANVGIVDAEGRLCCPEGRRILPGTSMLAARKIAPQRLPVVERPIRREEIFTAREMLLFTSASLCVGISHFEGRPIGQGPDAGRPGPVARWLRDALLEHMLATGTPF